MKVKKDRSSRLLVNAIVEGIQEKKGKEIAVLNLTKIEDAICDYMVIAEANTPTQLEAMEGSVAEFARNQQNERPMYVHEGDGHWIALDYIDVIVHLMTPDVRAYYALEQLWADADIQRLPDID